MAFLFVFEMLLYSDLKKENSTLKAQLDLSLITKNDGDVSSQDSILEEIVESSELGECEYKAVRDAIDNHKEYNLVKTKLGTEAGEIEDTIIKIDDCQYEVTKLIEHETNLKNAFYAISLFEKDLVTFLVVGSDKSSGIGIYKFNLLNKSLIKIKAPVFSSEEPGGVYAFSIGGNKYIFNMEYIPMDPCATTSCSERLAQQIKNVEKKGIYGIWMYNSGTNKLSQIKRLPFEPQ